MEGGVANLHAVARTSYVGLLQPPATSEATVLNQSGPDQFAEIGLSATDVFLLLVGVCVTGREKCTR